MISLTSPVRKGLRVQARVVYSLMLKDAMSRFGHENLGFFWIVAEPMILTMSIMLLWSIAHMSHGAGVEVLPFALSGYSFITLWRHIANRSVGTFKGSIMLRYHRHVSLIDVMISLCLLELIALFTSFCVLYIPIVLVGWCSPPTDCLNIVAGFVFTAWFSFAFGLFLAGFASLSHVLHHVIPPAMYITMPLTGTFAMEAWLPENVRNFLLWSPLVNCVELLRSGLFGNDVETFWSLNYIIVSCLLTTAIGVGTYAFALNRMEID